MLTYVQIKNNVRQRQVGGDERFKAAKRWFEKFLNWNSLSHRKIHGSTKRSSADDQQTCSLYNSRLSTFPLEPEWILPYMSQQYDMICSLIQLSTNQERKIVQLIPRLREGLCFSLFGCASKTKEIEIIHCI